MREYTADMTILVPSLRWDDIPNLPYDLFMAYKARVDQRYQRG